MADISQIKLPNNTVLNLKDNKFRNWSTGSDTVDFLTVKSCTSNSQKTLKLYIDDDGALIVRKGDNQSDVDYYNVSVVSTLPTTGNNKTFYFLSKTGTTGDVYDEYMYINSKWEKIGTTEIDLSGYALTEDIPTKVSQLTNDSGYLTTHQDISMKADKTEIPTKVSELTNDSGYLTSHQDISGKVDKIAIDNAGITSRTYTPLFGGSFSVTTATDANHLNPYAKAAITGRLTKTNMHRVTINGTEYILPVRLWHDTNYDNYRGFNVYEYLGNLSLLISDVSGIPGGTDNVPFVILFDFDRANSIEVLTSSAGNYTISVDEITIVQKELPSSLIYGDAYVPFAKKNNGDNYNSFSIGVNEINNDRGNITIGFANKTTNYLNTVIGIANLVQGSYGFVEGEDNTTGSNSELSHIEGSQNYDNGFNVHIEGRKNKATNDCYYDHIEGYYNTSNTLGCAHVEGLYNIVNGACTHVQGHCNIQDTTYPVWVSGNHYNVGDKVIHSDYLDGYICLVENSDTVFDDTEKWLCINHTSDSAFIIGNGLDQDNRSNALTVDWNGNQYLKGDAYVNCAIDGTGGTKLATISDLPEYATDADTQSIIAEWEVSA